MNRKIGFIGTGNMGRAMIGGLMAKKTVAENQIYVSDRNTDSLDQIQSQWQNIECSTDNKT